MRFILLLLSTISLAAQTPKPTLTPIGLRVNGSFPGQSFEFEPIGYVRGTVVDLYLTASDLIAIDQEASTLTSFTDDTGKDLLKSPDGGESAKFGPFPKINAAGTAASFDVRSPELLAKSAHSVTLSGKLMVKTGSVKAESVNKQVSLIKGAKLVSGAKQFVIERVDKDGRLALELRTEDAVDEIAGLSVIDTAGKKTAAVNRMSSTAEIAGRR